MCSISGLLTTDSIDREVIDRMNAAQTHRGPDDEGVSNFNFDRGSIAFGNTRLAILDTSSAGHQPMLDPETGNCITYNGETYNFRDLSEYIRINPCSKSDTEVVLRAYSALGINLFAKLRGMFALAIWDDRKRELVLAAIEYSNLPFSVTFARR